MKPFVCQVSGADGVCKVSHRTTAFSRLTSRKKEQLFYELVGLTMLLILHASEDGMAFPLLRSHDWIFREERTKNELNLVSL